ncbi:MAG: Mov34/MPN/PAD-1 family protein [Bdellovibrionales bacterium]|nr:Mov34/MPN/PAD-1 family protein [Bdellovibrionales bacterium]
MKIVKYHNDLKLIVDENLLAEIGRIGIEHYPNEFGGFLIGNYSQDFKTLYLNHIILPKKFVGHPCKFERSIEGLENMFEELFNNKGQYYIGEWHTHPNGSTRFSQTDYNAMVSIAEHRTVSITNPILLILSVTAKKLNGYTFYVYDDKKLLTYE